MTMQNLIDLRLSGKVPPAVWVVVGDKPKTTIAGLECLIHVNPLDDVRRLDFRPLVGLHVDVFEHGDHASLLDTAILAIDAAKPKSTGLACKAGICGLNESHERVLRRVRELICN